MNLKTSPVIVWFRRDLRLNDNPALIEACKTGRPVICIYIYETNIERELGGASKWWLHHSLQRLEASLASKGASLILKKGIPKDILTDLTVTNNAKGIYWNRRYAQDGRERDAEIKTHFKSKGINVSSYRANLLTEPWTVETKTGGYYKVFTPYWRAAKNNIPDMYALKAPESVPPFEAKIQSDDLKTWDLLPNKPDWGSKLKQHWQIGPNGAHNSLNQFLEGPVKDYTDDRNRPDRPKGTSHLSPHLAFGEISPREIWQKCHELSVEGDKFLSEIGWREFSYVLLFHNPQLASKNYKPDFDKFEWEHNNESLTAWQKGLTGYPFVDAGMRQLWQTGWQHNRVRMVTASFLIKHLLIDWREGEKWFHDTLVDADPASNAASWQWVAGSGADASPYFRIFNPFTQGEKFDPDGEYVKKYVPELAKLPKKYIHRPWEAPINVLEYANVKLGHNYPKPIVDHKMARERALKAYKKSRS